MTNICEERVIRRLNAALPENADSVSDGRLLDRFIQFQDESAFEEIVRRHGLMVLGVCQRVLDNRHDAEDCFQAVFMVLVRKATTIHPRDMVGNWLYGVAYRTALEARKLAARRRIIEKKKHDMPQPESPAELWQELRPVLDQEMSRLPDKYRFVLIACDLEGKTRKTVADLLGVPEGTVASRLARARTMLAKRLQRHRLIVSPGLLANLLTQRASASSMPETLVEATAKLASDGASSGVAALADAVVQAMFWTKLKIASAIVCVIAFLGLAMVPLMPSANAERKPESVKKKPQRISDCVVRKVDFEARTLQAEDEATALHQLRVDPDTRIIVAGRDAKLADLQTGMIVNVEVRLGGDGRQHATRIEAIGQAISGSIQRTNDGSVTIHAEGVIQESTYEVEPAAGITIDGKKSKLGDLKVKMKATLRLAAGKPVVVAIDAAGSKVEGVVKSVDAKGRSLSIDRADPNMVAEAVMVAPDAVVKIDGKDRELRDVKTGMRVTLQMSAEPEPSRVVGILAGLRKP